MSGASVQEPPRRFFSMPGNKAASPPVIEMGVVPKEDGSMCIKPKMLWVAIGLSFGGSAFAADVVASGHSEARLESQSAVDAGVSVADNARAVVVATQAGSRSVVDAAIRETRAGVRTTLDTRLEADLRNDVELEIGDAVDAQVEAEVQAEVGAAVATEVAAEVAAAVAAQLEAEAESALAGAIESEIDAALEHAVESEIDAAVEQEIESSVETELDTSIVGALAGL